MDESRFKHAEVVLGCLFETSQDATAFFQPAVPYR
jgi:hypothetical protein